MPTTLTRPARRRFSAVALTVVLATAVSGCLFAGGEEKPEALPSPTLSAKPVPTTPAGDEGAADLEQYYSQDVEWRTCRGDLECAEIRVPLDYEEPDGETIEIALLRVKAANDKQRIGSLVVNPGGPGGSGIGYAANASTYFGSEVRQAFDIVGFDPRGVGESTPIDCLPDEKLDTFVASDPDPDTPAEVKSADEMIREFGEGCVAQSGDLASHVSTAEAARDIDIIREVLGDRRLSWFGASYGTFLGATYAELFPERVGRMVLDGAIDPSLSNEEMSLVQARGFEVALRAYVKACVDRGDCFLGDSVDAGTKRIREFLDEVERRPLPASNDRQLEVGNAVLGIWAPLYNEGYWPLLDQALRSGFDGEGQALMTLSDAYTSRGPDGYLDNSLEALYAVNCLDHDDTMPSSEVADLVPKFEKASPTFGAIFAYGLSSCEQWPVDGMRNPGKLTAEGAEPILVIGTSRDPATPLEWAEALASQLDSGVLVARDGDGHTGYNAGNQCVDDVVESYLVSGEVPESDVSC
ncbi:MAG TPA: alpha/beta hydrolase [Nocardioidaceae bacterium]|nr:alpha/beta hydrolase [Nocardioidaceae bacterium]